MERKRMNKEEFIALFPNVVVIEINFDFENYEVSEIVEMVNANL